VSFAERVREQVVGLYDKSLRWILHRMGLALPMEEQMKKGVPRYAMNPIYCLGGLTLVAFIVQVITGVFLALYYVPSVDHAWDSIRYIEHEVPFGFIVRNIHRWAANIMIIMVVLHALRVFFTKAYRPPRELNWTVGVVLLFLTVGVAFTGYVLPWDQRAYWAATVGTNLISAAGGTPLIGGVIEPVVDLLRSLLIGGSELGPSTLSRFYGFHILWLPGIIFLLMLMHFWMIRRHGIAERM
jgi:quinol-cytochrome oxidoreductase complex cytochrome b subunit